MLQHNINATVSLKPVASSNPTSRAMFANFTSDSRIICRNFNDQRGCMLPNCYFAHVCNRKVAGKACGLPHPGVSHKPSDSQSAQWLPFCSNPLNRDVSELVCDEDGAFLSNGIRNGHTALLFVMLIRTIINRRQILSTGARSRTPFLMK